MNAPSQQNPYQTVLQLLSVANALVVKAFNASSPQNLIFIILNDTLHMVRYDRAVLWRIVDQKPTILGVSGQSTFTTSSETVNRWQTLLSDLPDLSKLRVLSQGDFPDHLDDWRQIQKTTPTSVVWIPIVVEDNEIIGLWLEKWDDPQGTYFSQEKIKAVEEYLIPGYRSAWKKICSKLTLQSFRAYLTKRNISYVAAALLSLLLLIRVPLRIVAPCEVVAVDPYVITAPLEGIIGEITVQPGQHVKVNDILYKYDQRIPLQELKVAEKEVELIQSQMNSTIAAGVNDQRSLLELATLNIKLQEQNLQLEFAKTRFNLLVGEAPREGVISIDNPEGWRGKPVRVGERIMIISDPTKTRVKLWIPQDDNIHLEKNPTIKVFLNTDPEKSYEAKVSYIGQETTLNEMRIPSFIAEAEWQKPIPQAKLGVKGSAILYGEKVSLLYYVLRKPLSTLRSFLGI